MNKNSLVFVSIILIGFLAITSFIPKSSPADVFAQQEPNMPTIPLSENIIEIIGKEAPENLDNEILNGNSNWSPAGISFRPTNPSVTYYNASYGCIATSYTGGEKQFTSPIAIPDAALIRSITFYYYNTVNDPSDTVLYWYFNSIGGNYPSRAAVPGDKTGIGFKNTRIYLTPPIVFDNYNYSHWLEWVNKSATDNSQQLCAVRIWYTNPSPFANALPMINNR